MTAVVYLGPSLPLDEARSILPDAIYLPPVAQGDVLSLVEREHERPDVIGIVDGVFYLQPPIWHKEILYALELGIPVYGASSMGALRAAECDRFGMIGVGEVYRSYASGELSDDDDVALVYGEAQHGWPATSEPLVNVRATLAAEVASGSLSDAAARAVIASAKRLWFPERRLASILAAAREDGLDPGDLAIVAEALEQRYVDVKKSDARALLETLRDRDPSEKPAPFTFDRSIVFLAFTERDRQVSHGGLPIRLEEIKRHAAVEHPGFAEILDRALDRLLVTELARVWEVEPTEAEIDDEIERLRWRLRIGEGEEAIATWRIANDLTEADLRRLASQDAAARRLRAWVRGREDKRLLVQPVLNELRLRGEYEEWARRAARSREDASFAEVDELPSGRDLVREHMSEAGWRPDPPIERFSDEAAFSDLSDLLDELALSARTRRARRHAAGVVDSLLDADDPAV